MDRVTNLDRLCVSVGIFPRRTEIGDLITIRLRRCFAYRASWLLNLASRVSVAALKISVRRCFGE